MPAPTAADFVRRSPRFGCAAALAAVAVVALTGCGSGKPSYCADKTNLQNAVKGLTGVTSVSGLQNQVNKVSESAKALASSAKSDFPSETTAITNSVNALETTLRQAASTATRGSAVAKLPGQVAAVDTAINNFASATKSKCS